MTHATSVFRRRRRSPARLSGPARAWRTVLAAALVLVALLAIVLCAAWLAGDVHDLYAESDAGVGRAMPAPGIVSATRRPRPASPDRRSGGTGPGRRSMACC